MLITRFKHAAKARNTTKTELMQRALELWDDPRVWEITERILACIPEGENASELFFAGLTQVLASSALATNSSPAKLIDDVSQLSAGMVLMTLIELNVRGVDKAPGEETPA